MDGCLDSEIRNAKAVPKPTLLRREVLSGTRYPRTLSLSVLSSSESDHDLSKGVWRSADVQRMYPAYPHPILDTKNTIYLPKRAQSIQMKVVIS